MWLTGHTTLPDINLWNNLIEKKELYGFETNNDFYHLTDLKTFKKLQDL